MIALIISFALASPPPEQSAADTVEQIQAAGDDYAVAIAGTKAALEAIDVDALTALIEGLAPAAVAPPTSVNISPEVP